MKLGSLFTGAGGLDMAATAYFGAETVWTSDIDPGACRIIAHRYPDVPNLGDITTIDWAGVEPVDILTGGWPCQPWSNAGKRLGAADARALWPYVADAVRALRPRHVLLENVAAIASAGELARAAGDLAALGYVGSWRCLRAADVGAPHGRARIFITATANTNGTTGGRFKPRGIAPGSARRVLQQAGRRVGRGTASAADSDSPGLEGRPTQPERGNERATRAGSVDAAADTEGDGRDEGRPQPAGVVGRPDAAQCGDASPADATNGRQPQFPGGTDRLQLGEAWPDGERLSEWTGTGAGIGDSAGRDAEGIAWGDYEPAIRRWERVLGRVAPAPTEASPRGTQRLSPSFVEWLMGLPAGWVTDVPGLGRNAQLKALGNGVVPQQAYAALQLLDRLEATA